MTRMVLAVALIVVGSHVLTSIESIPILIRYGMMFIYGNVVYHATKGIGDAR